MSDAADNPAEQRFNPAINGSDGVAATCDRAGRHQFVLTLTIVPQEFSGQGIGWRLARGVVDAIRVSGRKAVPRRPFMGAFCARHPDYAGIVDGWNQPGETA